MTDVQPSPRPQTELRRSGLSPDPIQQLRVWYQEAVEYAPQVDWLELNAVTLATASSVGEVSARIVLLKGIDPEGIRFFTNYDSRKGRQLSENPCAAVCIHWAYLQRQVRIEGEVSLVDREVSEQYFHSRPRGSQISAAISDQSEEVDDRAALERRAVEFEQRFADQPVPLPENWGGYLLKASKFEFWQGRESRLHDRFSYTRDDQRWRIVRLAP